MESNATVTFSNGEKKVYKKGTNFITISRDITNPNGLEYLGVKVNNRVTELFDVLKDDCTLEFLDLASADGNKFYIRGLKLLLYRATRDLYGKCILNIVHSVHKGIYCTIDGVKITDAELKKIEKKMTEIVSKDEPIEKELFSKEDAIKIFEAEGLLKKVKLLKYRNSSDINLYKLGWVYDYFFGFMVPSTGYLKKFKLLKSERGFLLKHPTTYMMHSIPEDIRQDKLF